MADNRKCTITAKVSAQIVEYYRQALKNLETTGISDIVTSRRLKVCSSESCCACYMICLVLITLAKHFLISNVFAERLNFVTCKYRY